MKVYKFSQWDRSVTSQFVPTRTRPTNYSPRVGRVMVQTTNSPHYSSCQLALPKLNRSNLMTMFGWQHWIPTHPMSWGESVTGVSNLTINRTDRLILFFSPGCWQMFCSGHNWDAVLSLLTVKVALHEERWCWSRKILLVFMWGPSTYYITVWGGRGLQEFVIYVIWGREGCLCWCFITL